MSISGTGLLDNYNASVAYGASMEWVRQRIREWLDETQDMDIAEPGLIGFVMALRVLTESQPKLASAGLRVSQVEEWRDRYMDWFEKHRGKVKVTRGVSKDEIARLARKEFDAIIKALKKG